MISQTSHCIVESKWKDKEDVMFPSLKHRPDCSLVKSKKYNNGTPALKPAIADYNNAKASIDISDQIKKYGLATRRHVKWFRKVFVELLCNAVIVNEYILYVANKAQTVNYHNISWTASTSSFATENSWYNLTVIICSFSEFNYLS